MFTNDAGTYLIALYCDGPNEAQRHERFVVIVYGRLLRDDFPQGRSWVPVREWTGPDGQLTRARNYDTHTKRSGPPNSYLLDAGLPHLHYQYRFRCSRCGLDEQRNYGPDIDGVLDGLADHDIREISVRAFVSLAWKR